MPITVVNIGPGGKEETGVPARSKLRPYSKQRLRPKQASNEAEMTVQAFLNGTVFFGFISVFVMKTRSKPQ